eukprot:745972-Amphidinium_carterae.1
MVFPGGRLGFRIGHRPGLLLSSSVICNDYHARLGCSTKVPEPLMSASFFKVSLSRYAVRGH